MDSGIGISECDQKKLFKMFGKLKSTGQINTNGIGLGLHICKRICDSFQGSIDLEHSKVDQGSTFTFTIHTQGTPSGSEISVSENNERLLIGPRRDQVGEEAKFDVDSQFSLHSSYRQPFSIPKCFYKDGHIAHHQTLSLPLETTQIVGSQLVTEVIVMEEKSLHTTQILIVEDNTFNILALQSVLEELGLPDYDVCMNGKLGVEKVKSKLTG